MNAIADIERTLHDNPDRFARPFFEHHPQNEDPRAIALPGGVERRYRFPVYFGNVTCAVAAFLCDHESAAALLPHPSMVPVRMPRGRAVVVISNYIYRDISNGLPGYNEVAMNIPVILDGRRSLPVLPLVLPHPSAAYYPFAVPCGSLENKIRGQAFWGVPKTLHDIDITVANGTCAVRAVDESGSLTFALSIPTRGKPSQRRETAVVCSLLEGELARSHTTFTGEFNVHMRARALWSRGETVGDGGTTRPGAIELGGSPIADTLRRLKLESEPFQTRFAPSIQSVLALPHQVGR